MPPPYSYSTEEFLPLTHKWRIFPIGFVLSILLCYRYPFNTDAYISPIIFAFALISIISLSIGVTASLFKSHLELSRSYAIGLLGYMLISIFMACRGLDVNHLLILLTTWSILLLCLFSRNEDMLKHLVLCTGISIGIIITIDNLLLQRNNLYLNKFGFETITEQAFLICTAQLTILQTFTQLNSRIFKILLSFLLAGLIIVTISLESRIGIIVQLCCIPLFIINTSKPYRKFFYLSVCILIAFFACTLKVESTSGRIFIYKTSLSMLDNPSNIFFGRGFQGFRNEYMPIQAQKLKHENHATRQRADEINHPLNEFLNLTINYGIIITSGLVLATWLILRNKRITLFQKGYLFTLVMFSLFTYPFRYPITWYSLAIFIASLNKFKVSPESISINSKYATPIMVLLIFFMSHIEWCQWNNHRKWEFAFNNHILGKWELSDCIYEDLQSDFITPEFAYNNAAHYLEKGNASKALIAIKSCKVKNYSTTMLEGKIRAMGGDTRQALELFTLASDMCPNRFQPLFELYKLNIAMGKKLNATEIANKILLKPIKIRSNEITKIIHYVQESETSRNQVASPVNISMVTD